MKRTAILSALLMVLMACGSSAPSLQVREKVCQDAELIRAYVEYSQHLLLMIDSNLSERLLTAEGDEEELLRLAQDEIRGFFLLGISIPEMLDRIDALMDKDKMPKPHPEDAI